MSHRSTGKAGRARERSDAQRTTPAAIVPAAPASLLLIAWCTLAALVLFGYAHTLRQGFSNDDYLIFREVVLHPASLVLAWTRLIGGYWRPWSREFHFWSLHQLFGLNATAFHVANMVLWLGVLATLLAWARRITDARVAVLVVSGAFAASSWGVYVVWASCSQDLWMLLFGALFLLAQSSGRRVLATLSLVVALLSKETAVLVLAVGVWTQFVLRGREGLRPRAWFGPVLVVLAWALVHPSIGGHAFFGLAESFDPAPARELSVSGLRFALAPLNLETWPKPQQGWPRALVEGAIWAAALGTLAWSVLRGVPAKRNVFPQRRKWILLGIGWWAIGWLPLTLSVLPWHSYYGWFGLCGAWLAVVACLLPRPRVLVALIVIVAGLRPAATQTFVATQAYGDDWGTELRQGLAARRAQRICEQLLAFHPTLPPGSRIVVAGVPGGSGLLTGPRSSAAAEVWYHDTTVAMVGLSEYWRRGAGEITGPDYFYVLDREQRMYPLGTGTIPVPDSLRTLSEWVSTEEIVGATLAQVGDWERARDIFARLALTFPREARAAFNLGVAHKQLGDSVRAMSWLNRADSLVGAPPSGGRGFVAKYR